MELSSGQDISDGFHLQIGLAEIHVPRMWVERHPDNPDNQVYKNCNLYFTMHIKTEFGCCLGNENYFGVILCFRKLKKYFWSFSVIIQSSLRLSPMTKWQL